MKPALGKLFVLGLLFFATADGIGKLHYDRRPEDVAGPGAGVVWQKPEDSQLDGVRAGLVDDKVERKLEAIFLDIREMRLEMALEKTEGLLRDYPNYRLGHLIRGDLLLALSQGIGSFGALNDAPAEDLADLKAEALARLNGHREKPRADHVPRYLLKMYPEQKHAVVVDAAKSRLYLFENHAGQPRLLADYYISVGKYGVEKFREGDKRTPLGVYRVTGAIPKEALIDLYGSAAFPINYPNEWDKHNGRKGSGIWLHGTYAATHARPPQASNGCVVLTNQAIDKIAPYLQAGKTPVIISESVEWVPLKRWQEEQQAFAAALEGWRRDAESNDTARLARHYSDSTRLAGNSGAESATATRPAVKGTAAKPARVVMDDLSFFRKPGKDELMVVNFRQHDADDKASTARNKVQYWQRDGGTWKIVLETTS